MPAACAGGVGMLIGVAERNGAGWRLAGLRVFPERKWTFTSLLKGSQTVLQISRQNLASSLRLHGASLDSLQCIFFCNAFAQMQPNGIELCFCCSYSTQLQLKNIGVPVLREKEVTMLILHSTTMLVLQVIGSAIMVLWLVDTYLTYQLKKREGFDFLPVRRRNALIALVAFAAITIFVFADHYLEAGLAPTVIIILKVAWVVACVAWLLWRVSVFVRNKSVG